MSRRISTYPGVIDLLFPWNCGSKDARQNRALPDECHWERVSRREGWSAHRRNIRRMAETSFKS